MGAEQSTAGDFWTGEKINENWSKWMQGIPDSESLKDISIPGTHNSMSFYGGPLVRCQSMSLYNQYLAGIRFVDIRCRHYYDGLYIYHNCIPQRATLEDALNQTSAFLNKNQTETVILSIKNEHTSEHNNSSYEETLQKYIKKYPEKLFYTENRIPNLGEVRGKIVILQRFHGSIGINFGSQIVKDDSHVSTILPASIKCKYEGCLSNMEAARTNHSYCRSCFYITFCSGVSSGAYPNAIADRMNIRIRRHAEKYKGDGCLGIVVLDFPGSWVSHAIFMTNPGASP